MSLKCLSNTMFKLIIFVYLLIIITNFNHFCVAQKYRDRSISGSKNETRDSSRSDSPELRERVISTSQRNSERNDFDVRKDILDSISTKVQKDSSDSSNRRREISTQRDSNERNVNSKSNTQRDSKNTKKRVPKSNDYKCGGDIDIYISEEITSPLYPSKYPKDVDCKWKVKAQKGQTIKIEIFRLNIESDGNCKFDYLDIIGVRKLCGRVLDSVIHVNSSAVELRFRSDANNEDYGFHLRVSTESRGCVREVNVTNYAFVTSPNYPSNYDDLSDCWTLIRSEGRASLVLTFEVLMLEHDSQCAYDYIEVFDSHIANNSLGRLCEKPENVTLSVQSSKNILLLHFHSDQLLNNKGFRAEVTTSKFSALDGCDWKVNWNNMTLNSPNYPQTYPANLNCELLVNAPSKNEKIVILFDFIHLESGSKCENNDRVEIWEGNNSKPSRIICGRYSQPFKYVSQTRTIKLKFISDGFGEFPGFTARLAYLSNNKAEPRVISKLMKAPENASVIIGSTHIFHCEPLTNDVISWFKDDKKIISGVSADGKTLIIREFTTRAEGRYICKFGKEQREAWLTTKKTNCPQVIFRKRPKDMSVSEGDFVVLECNVVDAKSPIKWERDGLSLSNNSRVNQLHNGYLLLDPAKTEDTGIYFCVANPDSSQCKVKSGARISVSSRVNVKNVCGISHANQATDDVSKIIGGTESEKSAFPWHVMFWDYKRKAFCGGALLNERWVLTAAHCFETGPESAIEVKLGKYDQTVTEESEIVTKIAEVIRHPDFSRDTFDNDIALVRLSQHISFTPDIIPICLVDKRERRQTDEYFLKPNSALRIGHVTGWGQLKENGPQPRFLQELRVPIVEENRCRSSTAFKVTSNMFCAGYGKEVLGDACKGDSGGPFVVPNKSRWIILGVVSWGEGCGRSGKYGFYTRVNNYLDWINAIIKL